MTSDNKHRRLPRRIPKVSDWASCSEGFNGCLKTPHKSTTASQELIEWEDENDSESDQPTGGKHQGATSPLSPVLEAKRRKIDKGIFQRKKIFQEDFLIESESPVKAYNKRFKGRNSMSKFKDTYGSEDIEIEVDSPVKESKHKQAHIPPSGIDPMGDIIDMDSPVKLNAGNVSKKVFDNSGMSSGSHSICDFDSGSTSKQSRLAENYGNEIKNDFSSDGSPVISMPPSQDDPSSSVSTPKQKSSDWLKSLQWQKLSGEKEDPVQACDTEESKPRKIKFTRNGLAERLDRMILREKSAKTYWSHKVKGLPNKDSSKTLTIRVNFSNPCGSLILTQSELVAGGLDDFNCKTGHLAVVFSKSLETKNKIETGTLVKIHPPWQRLSQPDSSTTVILCTELCEILGLEESESETNAPVRQRQETILGAWMCPCRQDRAMSSCLCPAQTNPSAFRNVSMETQDGNSAFAEFSTDQVHPTVTSRSGHILENIENKGGSTAVGVGFEAIVQRVFNYKHTATQETRWSALLQDKGKDYCLLDISTLWCSELENLIKNGEGKEYEFHGLRVQQRINKSRCPGLFQVMESIWTPPEILSQEVDESQGSEYQAVAPPGFCYMLNGSLGESSCKECSENVSIPTSRISSGYTLVKAISLKEIRVTSSEGISGRCSCFARILYRFSEDDFSRHFWVLTDVSLQNLSQGDTIVAQLQDGFLPTLNTAHQSDELLHNIVFIKDAFYLKDTLLLDKYTRVYKEESLLTNQAYLPGVPFTPFTTEGLRHLQIKLPELSLTIPKRHLVAISGKIISIDENTAVSWTECEICHGEDLSESAESNRVQFCVKCQQNVRAVKKMNLELFIEMDQLKDVQIKVKLLQSSIVKLLPEEGQDEGHDIQSILEVNVGPLSCIIKDFKRNSNKNISMILLEEIWDQNVAIP